MRKFITLLLVFSFIFQSNVFALSKRGSRGTEVRNIQSRLSKWGYNPGAVDGIYGAKTEAAVKRF